MSQSNDRFDFHPFWDSHSPLSTLTGAALIIMASSRFAFALICAAALIWVYGFTALIFSGARSIMPLRGKMVILLFLSAFLCGIFMFLLGLINPLLIMGTSFFLVLIPPCCLGSGLFEASEDIFPIEFCSRALLEAGVLAGIILAFALIREPLGMGTLSFPGGIQGIWEVFDSWEGDAFIPIRFLSASAGGLLLLGYGIALFRHFRDLNAHLSRASGEE